MIGALIASAFLGFIIFAVGTFFDPTSGNKNARIAGLVVFVLAFLGYAGIVNL